MGKTKPGHAVGVNALVMQYAQNRIDMRIVKGRIHALLDDEFGDYQEIDLTPHRKDWLANHDRWDGWLIAVSNSAAPTTTEEFELARLLDKKAGIMRNCGQIKRNICAKGRSMILNA